VFARGGMLLFPSAAPSGRLISLDWPICGAGEAAVLLLDPPTWMVIFLGPMTGVSWPGVIFSLIFGWGGSWITDFASLSSFSKHS
jgi:hypothetical protein